LGGHSSDWYKCSSGGDVVVGGNWNCNLSGNNHNISGHHPAALATRTAPSQGICIVQDSPRMVALGALEVDIDVGHGSVLSWL